MTADVTEGRRGGPPSRLVSVLHAQPFMLNCDPDTRMARAVQLAGILGTAREAAQRYRTAVLHHDDLARQLCATFRYAHASAWNGYVPPRTDGYGAYNPSPYRARLVELVTEALNRDQDWRPYDSDRLAIVPERHIRAPWAETPHAQPEQEAGLWHESDR